MDKIGDELYLEPFAEGRLAGRRRAGDEYDAHAIVITARDLLGNLGDLFLLHRFRDENNLLGHSFLDGDVEIPHVIESYRTLEGQMLLVSVKHLILLDDGLDLIGLVEARHPKQEAVGIGNKVKQVDVAGRRSKATIEEVDITVELIIRGIDHACGLDQPGLVFHTVRFKIMDGLFGAHMLVLERQVSLDQVTHPGLDEVDRFGRKRMLILNDRVIAFRYRMLEMECR